MRISKNTKNQLGVEKKKNSEKNNPQIGFEYIKYSVSEANGFIKLRIEKKVMEDVTFWIRTIDDTAVSPKDFEFKDELITMKAAQKTMDVEIKVVDDSEWEPDKDFHVELLHEATKERLPGDDTRCTVTILDEDRPGIIGFKERFVQVRRKDQIAYIYLERIDGSDGDISCIVNTSHKNEGLAGKKEAVEHEDFVPLVNKRIEFKHNVVECRLEINMPDCEGQKGVAAEEQDTVSFAIEISDAKPEGVKLSKRNMCFINIEPEDQDAEEREAYRNAKMLEYFVDGKTISWGQQFKVACMLGPSIDEDNLIDDVTTGEAIMHFFAMPWKLIFAVIPPRNIWGGWLAFCIALAVIGLITAIVAEFANLLGCAIGLKTSVTAITLVAMGTSLPDTFASKKAAQDSPNADSAVGNVTGSNSVNVFLGLGLPWCIATVYWQAEYGQDYHVPKGSLAFSVIMFLSCSMGCFFILFLRR